MNSLRPSIVSGDTLFGTWTYIDCNGDPVAITDDLSFLSSVYINEKKHAVELTVLDQTLNKGEIAFQAQTLDWGLGIAEMDIKVVTGDLEKHSEKHCFNVVRGIS
ncbi:hypothetical protein [Acinetobacter guillouiae]|uniref:hypothetical protein n=1 Tax=Acinetobacter guillouiae TaxID=106649 RepID=UPI0032B5812B